MALAQAVLEQRARDKAVPANVLEEGVNMVKQVDLCSSWVATGHPGVRSCCALQSTGHALDSSEHRCMASGRGRLSWGIGHWSAIAAQSEAC